MLFGDRIPEADRYVVDILSQYASDMGQLQDIIDARAHRDAFVDACVTRIRNMRPRVVGFSTTFHQTCACLAVAGRLKEAPDPPIIIFGGANCEGEMGRQLLRSFPCIDHVSTREADLSFPAFLHSILELGKPSPVPGILSRADPAPDIPPALVTDLDCLPVPDYEDYFATLAQSPLRSEITPELLMETSRGCWWGEKHHCTFCGLNGETMAFRRKSENRVLAEMKVLSTTFAVKRIGCVDNILDVRFIRTLFPRLADSGLDLELFFEVKANLKPSQLAILKAGGVRLIQPGIESLSTRVLKLMRKGCTALQNVQLLRWCEELGLGVTWNLLSGFPGEDPCEYDHMAEILPLLVHLPAPSSCSPFRLDQFSPFFVNSEAFGLRRVRPAYAYFYVFPFGRRELGRLAYYFQFDYADGRDPYSYTQGVSRQVERWVASREPDIIEPPRLDARWIDGGFDVVDTRAARTAPRIRLEELAAELYLACDSAQCLATLTRALADRVPADVVHESLTDLVEKRLMIEMDGYYLSLAVLRERPQARQPLEAQHEAAPAASL